MDKKPVLMAPEQVICYVFMEKLLSFERIVYRQFQQNYGKTLLPLRKASAEIEIESLTDFQTI